MNITTITRAFGLLFIIIAAVTHHKAVTSKTCSERLNNMQYCNWLLFMAVLMNI